MLSASHCMLQEEEIRRLSAFCVGSTMTFLIEIIIIDHVPSSSSQSFFFLFIITRITL